tara:strand:- start:5504 stop:7291 length:1788 start_codon:yes stop_codon:yes gene_type:complete
MKNKFSLTPKPATKLNLKKILIYTVVVSSLLSGVIYTGLTFFGVIGNPTEVFAANSLGYTWEAVISIDHTKVSGQSDLSDFPMLIKVTNTDLKSISNGGKVESINGFDIVFADMNDNLLDHELESFNPATGEYIAWVRIPVLSATSNTDLKLYYGNTAITTNLSTQNVWSSIYDGVWHMSNNPSNGDLKDGAGSNDAQSYGNLNGASLTVGKIGKATSFNGTNDYFAIKDKKYNASGSIPSLTVTGWFKTTYNNSSWSGNWSMLDFDRSEYFNVFVHGNGQIGFATRGAGIDDFYVGSIGQYNDGNWHYVAAVYDGTDKLIYVDGVLMGTKTNPHQGAALGSGATRYGFIGEGSEASTFNGGRNGIYYEGEYDEIRLSNNALSADWLATAYTNQNSVETFFSIVFNASPLPVDLIDFSVQIVEANVEVLWSTATEINNNFFTIEKSTDAINFEFVGEVTGAGNSNSLQEYTYIDDNLLEGVSYYRLKQTDFDDEFKYFSPKTINSKSSGEGLKIRGVTPNPFSIQFTLSIESENAGIAEFTMFNINGTIVDVGRMHLNKGVTEYVYKDENGLLLGTYILNLVNGESLTSCKVVKR